MSRVRLLFVGFCISSNKLENKTVILLVGPTAAGKTAMAVSLAKLLHTKIISADSRQCFKELNVGVAKPSPEELHSVQHYFISSHSIHDVVHAGLFEQLALEWTAEIFRDHNIAVMTGGTGLYIKAFCEGLDDMPVVDPRIRQEIQSAYEYGGMAWLQQELRSSDPAFYATGEIQNPHRLMRALEIKRSTGRSILSFRSRQKKQRPFRIVKIGLGVPREELYRRIDSRVDQMMASGLLQEVTTLSVHRTVNALQTVGYREMLEHLDGKLTLDEATALIKTNTRHYAKRQLTWFKKDASIRWIAPGDESTLQEIALSCIK